MLRSVQNAPKQQPSGQLQKDCEQAQIEVEHLRAKVAAQDEIIKHKDEQIGALNALAEVQRMRAESLLKAVQERTTANVLDDTRAELWGQQKKLYEESITDYKLDRARIIEERDKARGAQKWWGIGGFILGAIAGSRSNSR